MERVEGIKKNAPTTIKGVHEKFLDNRMGRKLVPKYKKNDRMG